MQRKLYSYVRFSDTKQAKGNSISRQKNYAVEYAKEHGLILDDKLTMLDDGFSAYHQAHIKRGTFGAFLDAIENKLIEPGSILIVECLDRISRAEPIQAQALLSQIIMSGITVVTASDNKVYDRDSIKKNPMDLVYSLLIFVRANEESETKSKRVKQAIVAQIKKWLEDGHGKIIQNARNPYWCKPNATKTGFDLIAENAKTVKDIISFYQSGWGLHKITQYLNKNYRPFNGKKWYMKYIRDILSNPVLMGERSFTVDDERYVIQNYYPAILSSAEFKRLQLDIKNRESRKTHNSKYVSILTGMRLAYCGLCGCPMSSQNYLFREKDGKLAAGFQRIRCTASTIGMDCKNGKSVSIVPIQEYLFNYCVETDNLMAAMADESKVERLRKKLKAKKTELEKKELLISNAKHSILKLLEVGNGITASLNDMLNDFYKERQAIADSISSLENEISLICNSQHDIVLKWQGMGKDFHNISEEQRLLVRQLVKNTFKKIRLWLHPAVIMELQFYNDKVVTLEINGNGQADKESSHKT